MRALIASGIITAYTWLTAYEFWRGRSEQLVSRWPAIFMLFAHGALFCCARRWWRCCRASADNGMYGSVWLTVLSFEALLFTISIAFILLAMAKERTELRHRNAAMVDPLTGIANRRSFLQDAGQLAKRHRADPRPTAVLLIDLDHFKSINDRFGHALGDRVLEIFTEAARKSVRSTDLLGRLGGEEFAAVLYDTSRDKAMAVAERIRESFAAGRPGGRRPPGRRHREHRPCALRGGRARRARTAGAGRPGALFRQGKRAATGSRSPPSTWSWSARPARRRPPRSRWPSVAAKTRRRIRRRSASSLDLQPAFACTAAVSNAAGMHACCAHAALTRARN